MRRESRYRLLAVRSDNAEDFAEQFNEIIEEIDDPEPTITQDLSNGFSATILFKETREILESIADEFRCAGIRHTCRECPYHDIETNGTVKWVTCDYSELGETHLDQEACEFFYKMLKIGEVKAGEPCRSVKKNGRSRRW